MRNRLVDKYFNHFNIRISTFEAFKLREYDNGVDVEVGGHPDCAKLCSECSLFISRDGLRGGRSRGESYRVVYHVEII